MPNWFKKKLLKSRYTFSIEGDIFVEEEEDKAVENYNAEEKLIGILPTQEGLRINNYKVEPYSSI